MMVNACVVAGMASCAAPPAQSPEPRVPVVSPPDFPLARFMREQVNVPFSFVMLETATAPRARRVHRAASVLRDAARDLMDWSDPPVGSDEARQVFFAYAEDLENHVARLEDVSSQETDFDATTIEQIRHTCNDCHHFFRPASVLSPDVAYDWLALDHGGIR